MKRSLFAILLLFTLIFSISCFANSNNGFEGGDGTLENPYQIATAKQLDAIRNNLTAHYIQICDINLSEYENWIPIGGYNDESYGGSFNGQNFKISNLTINRLSENCITNNSALCGLFGSYSGTIANVELANVSISINQTFPGEYYGYIYVGSIGASCYYLDNCKAEGEITINTNVSVYIGGIAGSGNPTYCTNKTNINVFSSNAVYVGGVVYSTLALKTRFSNNYNYGDINIKSSFGVKCGGIIVEGSTENSVNYGNISHTNLNPSDDIPKDVFKDRRRYSYKAVGGIVGDNTPYVSAINCVNFGSIKVQNSSTDTYVVYAGGIVGRSYAESCYNLGKSITVDESFGEGNAYVGRISGLQHWSDYSPNYSDKETIVKSFDKNKYEYNGISKTYSEIICLIKDNSSIIIDENYLSENSNTAFQINFPESMTIDYNSERVKLGLEYIGVNDPEATFEIEDKNVAVLGGILQVPDVFTGEYNDISQQIVPKAPGKTVITVHLSDGTTRKCNLTITGTKIMLNDTELTFDQPPVNQDGNLLVPIRAIAEGMGKTVLWNNKEKVAFIDNTDNALIIPMGEKKIYIGNEKPFLQWNNKETLVPSQVINGRTLVPIRQFAESLGAVVEWDNKYRTAKIIYRNTDSEAMSSELFDAINLNYYIGRGGENPFDWYTYNIVNAFYDSRNKTVDQVAMGITNPWDTVSDLCSMMYGDTNAAINIRKTLHVVFENLPEDTSDDLDLSHVKDIKQYIDTGKDLYVEGQGLAKDFLKNHKILSKFNDRLLAIAKSDGLKYSSYIFDFAVFSAEEIAYWLSDYSTNMAYLDVFENALENQGMLDYNMKTAIEVLRVEYTDKYIKTLYDVNMEFIDQGISIASGGAYGFGKGIWKTVFAITGVNQKSDALKNFYSIYCFNGALDRELTRLMVSEKNSEDMLFTNSLISLQKATKFTVIDSIADMAYPWIEKREKETAENMKDSLKSWDYHYWVKE